MISATNPMIIIVFVWIVDLARNLNKISWDSVSPPKLSTDAPILNVFKPSEPCLFFTLRHDS